MTGTPWAEEEGARRLAGVPVLEEEEPMLILLPWPAGTAGVAAGEVSFDVEPVLKLRRRALTSSLKRTPVSSCSRWNRSPASRHQYVKNEPRG